MPFEYKIDHSNHSAIIHLKGKLIENSDYERIISDIDEFLAADVKFIALDLLQLEYLNSGGLNLMLKILTKARNSGGDVVLFNLSSRLKELIIMTKLDSVFTISTNQHEALKILNQKI